MSESAQTTTPTTNTDAAAGEAAIEATEQKPTVAIKLVPSLELLGDIAPSITVEAEYGDKVIEGSTFTAAHHTEAYANEPAPCCNPAIPVAQDDDVIVVSHLDLDSLGGVARAMGRFPEAPSFWELAGFVDLNGPHKLSQSGASDEDLARLYAYWAWNQSAPRFSRDEVTDVTSHVEASLVALNDILNGNEELLAKGAEFKAAGEALNKESWMPAGSDEWVALRRSDSFVNHLYDQVEWDDEITVAKAVVALNTKFNSVTVSFADEPDGANARDIVQALWGDEAGGHAGIAGSPRGQEMSDLDHLLAAKLTRLVLKTGAERVSVERSPHVAGRIYAFSYVGGIGSRHELLHED